MSRLPLRQPSRALTVVVGYLVLSVLAFVLGRAVAGNIGLIYGGMASSAGLLAVALLAPLPRGRTEDPDARPVLRRG